MTSEEEVRLSTIWSRYRLGGELRPLVCLAATVAAALVLGGLGMAGGWLRGMFRTNLVPTGLLGDVRNGEVVTGALVGGAVWVLLLFWIWRPAVRLDRNSWSAQRRRHWGRPIAVTAVIGAGVTIVSYVIYRRPWDDVNYLVWAMTVVAAGVAALFWLPTIVDLERGRPVVGADGGVNVSCPRCGHSMVGLRETVCPECGAGYTIDGLIRQQDYAAHRGGDEGDRPSRGG